MSATRDEPGDRDDRARPAAVCPGCLPGRVPAGRWPADYDRPPAPGQQLAVAETVARLLEAPGPRTVNGPPGVGQVTLLRELAAAIVVARAERLAELPSPAAAFDPPARDRDRRQPGRARPAVTPLNQALAGLEIVVAAADNGAAENITAEITGPESIGAQWREAAAEVGYFSATARLVHGEGAWAMVAVRLGGAAERQAFAGQFCLEAPGRADGCPGDLPGRPAGPPVSWDAAREEFLAAGEKASVLAAERAEVAVARARLTDLRRDAATAYAAITATEDTLRTLAGQRVAAERSLRAAWHRCQAAARALDAHARAKPGLRASRPAWLGGGREWRAGQGELGAALRDCEATVSTAQRAVAEARAGFAAAVQARAEPAAALRRLTAECAAAQEVIARADPRADQELAHARTGLFLAALALHKALICAQASRVRENLDALADFLSGNGGPGDPALLAAWQTFFLVVPVVCTTFASVPALFGGLERESVGWLVIDETGQAPSRQVTGAIGRAKRTVTVGEGPPSPPGVAGRDGGVAGQHPNRSWA